jgi:hypothetical protein
MGCREAEEREWAAVSPGARPQGIPTTTPRVRAVNPQPGYFDASDQTGLGHIGTFLDPPGRRRRCGPAYPSQNTVLMRLSNAFGNSVATSIAASPLVIEAVRVFLPSGVLYISAP